MTEAVKLKPEEEETLRALLRRADALTTARVVIEHEAWGYSEAKVALLVARLSPEEYERFGPAVQELGLALAELRQAMEDLGRAEERVHNAIRLWDAAE